jgi:hypothetical protein
MQLISLQIGTAPLSCYANPEDRNILYSNARKTTFPAKFAMSVANEGTELGYSKEEIASIFNAKWNAKETPPCLGYGMLPLTSRIATEGVGL